MSTVPTSKFLGDSNQLYSVLSSLASNRSASNRSLETVESSVDGEHFDTRKFSTATITRENTLMLSMDYSIFGLCESDNYLYNPNILNKTSPEERSKISETFEMIDFVSQKLNSWQRLEDRRSMILEDLRAFQAVFLKQTSMYDSIYRGFVALLLRVGLIYEEDVTPARALEEYRKSLIEKNANFQPFSDLEEKGWNLEASQIGTFIDFGQRLRKEIQILEKAENQALDLCSKLKDFITEDLREVEREDFSSVPCFMVRKLPVIIQSNGRRYQSIERVVALSMLNSKEEAKMFRMTVQQIQAFTTQYTEALSVVLECRALEKSYLQQFLATVDRAQGVYWMKVVENDRIRESKRV